jgi:hypothetical protein
MKSVTVIDHPLVQHKLTLMRDRTTSTAGFRTLLREIAHLLCYEVTRDIELETTDIETPMGPMTAPIIKVFFDLVRQSPIRPLVIDLSQGAPDKITDREPPGRWNFPQLDALWAGDEAARHGRT